MTFPMLFGEVSTGNLKLLRCFENIFVAYTKLLSFGLLTTVGWHHKGIWHHWCAHSAMDINLLERIAISWFVQFINIESEPMFVWERLSVASLAFISRLWEFAKFPWWEDHLNKQQTNKNLIFSRKWHHVLLSGKFFFFFQFHFSCFICTG